MGIDADVKQSQGRFACLLAHDLDAADVSSLSEPIFGAFPGANVPPFFKFLLAKHLQVMYLSTIVTIFLHTSYLHPNWLDSVLQTLLCTAVHIQCCTAAENPK